ncbi:hypothetical protein ACM66B_001893 [Microbotryomycetes sp. NB124-2]
MLVARPPGQQHSLHMIPTQPSISRLAAPSSSGSTHAPASTGRSTTTAIIINGRLTSTSSLETSGGRLKKFKCTYEDCDKAYTRPVRLEEHLRSHTGERPFACTECDATFQRDSHLKAHQRTHLPASAKSYECQECDRKFWTGQHLRKHVEVMHRGKTYDCSECDASFRKHHLLRAHVAEAHSAPGTLPFKCEHDGCDRSFKQLTHLKTHLKTHNLDRYLCAHPNCLDKPLDARRFGTWSALQKHTKDDHPPTCPHEECQGKTFTTSRGLRKHLQGVHSNHSSRRRRRVNKGKNATQRAAELSDSEQSARETDFSALDNETDNDRPRKKQKRVAEGDDMPPLPDLPPLPDSARASDDAIATLQLLTGYGYSTTSSSTQIPGAIEASRKFECPYPSIVTGGPARHIHAEVKASTLTTSVPSTRRTSPVVEIVVPSSARSSPGASRVPTATKPFEPIVSKTLASCEYWFHRLYDVERHLKARHSVSVSRDELAKWYDNDKRA